MFVGTTANTNKMEVAALRALLKTSRNTIAMLQEQLREKEEGADTATGDQPHSPGLVLGENWKTTSGPRPSGGYGVMMVKLIYTSINHND